MNPIPTFLRAPVTSLIGCLCLFALPPASVLAAEARAGSSSSVDLIDPAAFGFGRPGAMVDVTFIDTQDFANRDGGLDFFETRTILRVSLSLRTGMNVGGELELRDSSNRVLANETLKAAPFGAVNLRWQF
jgi:hypothetical protein